MSNSPVRPGSDEEWEALLRQLRHQPKAQPRPFFYARVHARLAASAALKSPWLPDWVRRPAYVALLGALGLAVSGDDVASRPLLANNQHNTYQLSQPAPLLPR
ncbi:hypothetical protein [Hymenobacter psoromatis]|uniref:hypothetical protein n=1 Tax=Hymenobacter psoromatis TaxID=1484116 RepID=UPI001CC0E73C|nr:hypothetical protein [Hymenobacter psoromatis]